MTEHIVKLSTTLNHCSLTKKPDSLLDWWSTKLQPVELKIKLLWNLSPSFPGSTRRFLPHKAGNSNSVMGCLPLPKIRLRHKLNMCGSNQTEIRICYYQTRHLSRAGHFTGSSQFARTVLTSLTLIVLTISINTVQRGLNVFYLDLMIRPIRV